MIVKKRKYLIYDALNPFFAILMEGLAGLVDGEHFFETIAEDALFDFRYNFPGCALTIRGRLGLMEQFSGYGNTIRLHAAAGVSSKGPGGFDYAGTIQVLGNPFLKLSSEPTKIEVQCDYPASECGNMTTLSIPDHRVFFGFDFLYNGVHAWYGQGVDNAEINNWIQTIEGISQNTKDDDRTFYCGHGAEGKRELLSKMKQYLQTFIKVTATAVSRKEAIGQMKSPFAGFGQEDVLLVQSVNFHVKESAISSTAATRAFLRLIGSGTSTRSMGELKRLDHGSDLSVLEY
jgi:hypothetical protein